MQCSCRAGRWLFFSQCLVHVVKHMCREPIPGWWNNGLPRAKTSNSAERTWHASVATETHARAWTNALTKFRPAGFGDYRGLGPQGRNLRVRGHAVAGISELATAWLGAWLGNRYGCILTSVEMYSNKIKIYSVSRRLCVFFYFTAPSFFFFCLVQFYNNVTL